MSNNNRIVINDIDLDLYPDTVIAQTLQAANIGDLTTRKFNFTNTFTIPDTPTNQSVYEQSNNEQSLTNVPYTKRLAKVIQNGIETVPNGLEVLTEAGEDFKIYIISGAKNFFESVGTKKLWDLTGFFYEITSSFSAYVNSTSGLIIPAAHAGTRIASPVDSNGTLPFLYYKDVIDRIFTDAGFTNSGAIFSTTKFITTAIGAYGASKDGYGEQFMSKRYVKAQKTVTQNFSLINGFPGASPSTAVTFPITLAPGTNPLGYWDGTSKYISENSLLSGFDDLFKVKVKVTVNITVTSGTVNILLMNGSSIVTADVLVSGAVTGIYSVEIDTYARNDINSFAVDTDLYVALQYSSGVSPVAAQVLSGTIEFVPYPEITNMFYAADALPNMTQKDLLIDFAIANGILFEENNGVVYCKTIEEIITDTVGAVDWTDKRVNPKDRNITFLPNIYAQENVFSYSDNDSVINKKLYDGTLSINNDNIPLSKVIYTRRFQSLDSNLYTNIYLPNLNAYVESNSDMTNDPGYKLVLIRQNRGYEPAIDFRFFLNPGTLLSGVTTYKVAYFDDIDETLSMSFQDYLNDNYTSFFQALQKAKTVKRYYYLNQMDIANFSFLRLIFDGDAYYMVNKIINFIPGKVTQVELFKVS